MNDTLNVATCYGFVKRFFGKIITFLKILGKVVTGNVAMSNERNFRGKRMREAMNHAGLTSGQVAYRMGVSDGAVRGWTTGRRGIGLEELVKFAGIVGYPVEYFLYPEYQLPRDFSLRHEVGKLAEEVAKLADRIAEEPGVYLTTTDALEHIRKAHHLNGETVEAIRRIIESSPKCDGEDQ